MRQVILDFPKQFAEGFNRAKDIRAKGPFSDLVLCGIGGSALPGNILNMLGLLSKPLTINRDYGLPSEAEQNSLIIAISFSGNTEETISAYEEALQKGFPTLALTTGGKLAELAQQHGQSLILVPHNGIQPRCATGLLTAALVKALANSGLMTDPESEWLSMAQNLNPEKMEKTGQTLAQKLIGKIPVVYASNRFKHLARIWKIKFNENAKIMGFWNYFPELNHNEMVGLTNLQGRFHFLILKDAREHPRNLKRMELFAVLAKEKGAEVDFVEITGKTMVDCVFQNLLLGDWVTYYLALAYNQDPAPVKIVEDFKKRMAE